MGNIFRDNLLGGGGLMHNQLEIQHSGILPIINTDLKQNCRGTFEDNMRQVMFTHVLSIIEGIQQNTAPQRDTGK